MAQFDSIKEEIRAQVDIASVIGRYVKLKPSGKTLKGLCPFHKEKTPSFHVNPSLGFFHCFGCGKGGDVFSFLQEIEGVSFFESLRMLADECGISLELKKNLEEHKEEVPISLPKTELIKINEIASKFFYSNIKKHPEAITYFKSRGLRPEIVRDFRLGYAPSTWTALTEFCWSRGISEKALIASGLTIKKEDNRLYDRFRNRIMFSLIDLSGKVVGFAGRGISDDVSPKYLNSPETPIYKKKNFLYGLYHSKNAIKEKDFVIIVEGYMDYLSLFQAGICNVVAVSGTALTPEHIYILRRFTKNIILTFDGDLAGQNAAERAVFNLATENIDLYLLSLPEEEDPDSLVKKYGAEGFYEYLNKKEYWLDFIIKRLMKRYNSSTPVGKAAIVDALAPIITAIKDSIVLQNIKKEIAEKLRLDEKLVHKRYSSSNKENFRKPELLTEEMKYTTTLEGRFLKILFLKPELIEEVRNYISPETLTDTLSSNIYSLMLEAYEKEKNFNNIIDYTDDPEVKRYISLLMVKEEISENLHEEMEQKIIHLRKKYLKALIRECRVRIKLEPESREELLRIQQEYSHQLKELD
ncbi:MAG: DNA primase [Chitinispirillaceae bacterium]|nr:DNA primase [Chitinispirillaceae bacterium]